MNQQVHEGVARRLTTVPWTVFYMVPKATIMAPITRLTRQRVAVAVAIALGALVVGVGFAAMLARPLRRIARASAALAAGALGTRVETRQRDELGQLGRAFNAMAERLEAQAHKVRHSQEELERRVAQRTAELIASNAALKAEIAERARAEAAVAASERRYRELYESAPDMYATVELRSELIVDCNQTMCDRLGYEKPELIGQPVLMVYHPDHVPERSSTRAQLQQAGELLDVERTLRSKDGRAIEVSLHVRGVRDATGQIGSLRAVWRDVTKRKQLERDQALLLRVSETLRISTDVTDVLEAVSTQLAEYLHVSRCMFSEIDGANDEITIHRDYHAGLASLRGRLALSEFGGETAAEYGRGVTVAIADTATDPRTAPSFERSYAQSSIRAVITVPLMRAGRWVACLSVCARKIRAWEDREVALVAFIAERVWLWIEHLKALAQLRERDVALAVQRTEERFRALVEGVRDYAIFMLDPEGNVATWNAGAERLKGYSAAEIIGKSLATFSTPEDRARDHHRFVLDQARTSGRYEEEAWRVRKDGSSFWANIVITSVRGRDGELEGFAKVTRDFTERRAQDEALRAKQAALSQSLKEREVLLQEVHHRVKNNLQVISSLINMQARKIERGATRDALVACKTRVLAIALIHEKLYQSQDYSQVPFADYARGLAANVFHATGSSQQDVALELAIDDVSLGVDRAIPCGLVMNELITNALKHGFPDGRSGVIRIELRTLEDGQLRLTVEDNGAGLPDGFDLDRAQSMGLQLVRTLAEQLHAKLVIRSDHGTAFQLTFEGGG